MLYSDKIVDLSTTKMFLPEHLDIHKQLIDPDLLPEWYRSKCEGGLLPNAIRYVDTTLTKKKDIHSGSPNEQAPRYSSHNPAQDDIHRDFIENGFKLGTVPQFIYIHPETHKQTWINGRSREQEFMHFGTKNRITARFTLRDSTYSNNDARNALSLLGTYFNSLENPAGDVLQEDIFAEAKQACKEGWIDAKDQKQIYDRMLESSGKGKFTKDTLNKLSFRVYHFFQNRYKVRDWSTPSFGLDWLKDNNYVDVLTPTRLIRFHLVSYSTLSNNITRIAEIANSGDFLLREENTELRVIFHTGELTGHELDKNYEERILFAFKETKAKLRNIGCAFFNEKPPMTNKVSLYGALPAVEEVDGIPYHKMDRLVKFREDNGGELYQ